MTIKEVEIKSGLQRSNIRFYERCGLLKPQVLSNKYREYSQEDLDELMRIKLLRGLGITVEQIKQLQSGRLKLRDVMDTRIKETETEAEGAQYAGKLCRAIFDGNISYSELNGSSYADYLPTEENDTPMTLDVGNEAANVVKMTFKRIAARLIDMTLYSEIFLGALRLFGLSRYDLPDLSMIRIGSNFSVRSFLISRDLAVILATFLLMLIIEPVLLHFFGTTAGKWLMGLRVKARDGSRLDYTDSLKRTFGVIFYGYALGVISIVTLICQIRNVYNLSRGETMEWDLTLWSKVTDGKVRGYRFAVCITAAAVVFIIGFAVERARLAPPNTGELTVGEFAENFNYLSGVKYIDFFARYDVVPIDENGVWTAGCRYPLSESSAYGNSTLPLDAEPVCSYVISPGGNVTKVTFELEKAGDSGGVRALTELVLTMAQAYAFAEADIAPFSPESFGIEREIRNTNPFEDFRLTVGNTLVAFEVEYSGYVPEGDYLEPYFRCALTMEKLDN